MYTKIARSGYSVGTLYVPSNGRRQYKKLSFVATIILVVNLHIHARPHNRQIISEHLRRGPGGGGEIGMYIVYNWVPSSLPTVEYMLSKDHS